ncbi:MAG TPA: hypothetical protein VFU47_15610 [Armatimonadota bacterium]|nr:hypothetical protein [Armatimonadota bacterium]
MSTNKPTVTTAEALDRMKEARESGVDDAFLLGVIAAMDPVLVVRALEEIQARRVDRAEVEAPAREVSRGAVVIDCRDPANVLVRGAGPEDRSADILTGMGWYWNQRAQAYARVVVTQFTLLCTENALRNAGLTVERVRS